MNRLAAFFLLYICCSFQIYAQDTNFVRRVVCELSSAEMHGRWIPYGGDSIAAQFIRNELSNAQIMPLNENYYQSFQLYGYSMEGDVKLMIDNRLMNNFYDYRLPFSAPTTHGSFPLIHADLNLWNYDKDSYRNPLGDWNKFVRKNANHLDSAFVYFDLSQLNRYDKVHQQYILDNINYLKYSKSNRYNFKGIVFGTNSLPGFGPIYMGKRDFTLLFIDSESISKKSRKITLDYTNEIKYHQTQNVCAVVKGTHQPDTFVVITAHYDHIGQLGDDCIFPGAHDNASGTALVLDLARYYQQNPYYYSIAFLFFTGEESGLLGSTYFVEHSIIQLDKIKQVVNFDLCCGGDDGIMIVNATDSLNHPWIDTLVQINENNQFLTQIKFRNNAKNSDHYPFTTHEIPSIFVYTMGGFSAQVHHPSDTCNNCFLNHYSNLFGLFRKSLQALIP